VRLPQGDLAIAGDGTSIRMRRFVALSAERLAAWMSSDLSKLDLLIVQIDVASTGKLGLVAGAAENTRA
jgi:putative transposase